MVLMKHGSVSYGIVEMSGQTRKKSAVDVLPRFISVATLCFFFLGCRTGPTSQDATLFVDKAETRLTNLWMKAGRAAWVQMNFITDDTTTISSAAQSEALGATMELAIEASRFDNLDLSEDLRRKLNMLKTSITLTAPSNSALQAELSDITTSMESTYGLGIYCPDSSDEECLDLMALEAIMAESRETDELLDAWKGWRTISVPMRTQYERFVELANEGARELGFRDLGEMWRSNYDMSPNNFVDEVDRLWEQVRPFYDALHCHVRASLSDYYGNAVVPLEEPIPAHLLGNMWSQTWSNIYDLVKPKEERVTYDLTRLLESKGVDEIEMVRYGERFFSSIGFDPLPETFWERSLFIKPNDRQVVCHASAWNLDLESDLRIKMCINVRGEDFVTIHHELGHNYYQRAYNQQSLLFREGANDGFHEGIGDTIALSITPEYLVKVGLLKEIPSQDKDLGLLLRLAMDKIAFLPFGLLVDQWRWQVFSGEIPPEEYTSGWWKLREKYQGVRAPVVRSEVDFDPGAKYHIPGNTPYARYFLAAILQFQFHRGLCAVTGFDGPLHRCSIYDSPEAGAKLKTMLEMGASQPWPEALRVITGRRELDATAITEYFAPLKEWLDIQNTERTCGW